MASKKNQEPKTSDKSNKSKSPASSSSFPQLLHEVEEWAKVEGFTTELSSKTHLVVEYQGMVIGIDYDPKKNPTHLKTISFHDLGDVDEEKDGLEYAVAGKWTNESETYAKVFYNGSDKDLEIWFDMPIGPSFRITEVIEFLLDAHKEAYNAYFRNLKELIENS